MLSWQYIAGFFDGEGSVRIRCTGKDGKYPYCYVNVGQAGNIGREVLEEIREFLIQRGFVCRRLYISKGSKLGKQVMWRFEISRRADSLRFLEGVLPHLRVKRIQAQDIWRFCKFYSFPRMDGRISRWHTKR